MVTRAAVLRAFGAPQAIEQVQLRGPGRGEALVRLTAAGVCHSDVGQADGEWDYPLPAVLGHEGAGVVEEVGPGVAVEPGTRVLLSSAPGCGRCAHCLRGQPILCQDSLDAMGAGRLTTGSSPITQDGEAISAYSLLACFSHHAVVAERSLIALPDDVSDEAGALLGCAVLTGVGAAIASIEVPAGSRGAVIGAGGVGINAIQGARARGATSVLAVDPSADRLDWARRFGATEVLDSGARESLDALRAAAPREGLDWTIVTSGHADAMTLGVELLQAGGNRRHRGPGASGPPGAGGHAGPGHLRAPDRRLGLRIGQPGAAGAAHPRSLPRGGAEARRAGGRALRARGHQPGLRRGAGGARPAHRAQNVAVRPPSIVTVCPVT